MSRRVYYFTYIGSYGDRRDAICVFLPWTFTSKHPGPSVFHKQTSERAVFYISYSFNQKCFHFLSFITTQTSRQFSQCHQLGCQSISGFIGFLHLGHLFIFSPFSISFPKLPSCFFTFCFRTSAFAMFAHYGIKSIAENSIALSKPFTKPAKCIFFILKIMSGVYHYMSSIFFSILSRRSIKNLNISLSAFLSCNLTHSA